MVSVEDNDEEDDEEDNDVDEEDNDDDESRGDQTPLLRLKNTNDSKQLLPG